VQPAPVFQLFGRGHLVIIALTLAVPIGLGLAVRATRSRRLDRAVAVGLSLLLVANYLGYAGYLLQRRQLVWQQALPFQLCDWAMVTIIVALLTRRQSWSELSYFWGIGGTLQAILTPNLPVGFPDIRFLSFFVGHCGIVAGVIYLLVARRLRILSGSVWRTLAWSELYLAVTLLVDHLTNVNYGFLLHKPAAPSILDYLSRTHWLYLVELNLLAWFFFALLYAPFAIRDLVRRQAPASGSLRQE
jgi:hypothetical integral membrane protein (TIGR02206 family)